MQIVVNGRQQAVADGTSLAELLKKLDLNAQQVAVEVNLQLVPRTEHAQHCLADGDSLEVVTIVGGG
jgi:sulfur carrier protein